MKAVRFGLMFILALLALSAAVSAQDTAACPANVLLALGRTGGICGSIPRDYACYGNGTVSASFFGVGEGLSFVQPGDTAPVGAVRVLQVGAFSSETVSDWSIATLHIKADLVEEQQGRSVSILLFGDAEVENHVPPLPELPVSATGTLNIRTLPLADADIITRMELRQTVIANGRTLDSQWLRVLAPESGTIGWASTQVITTAGSLSALNVVDETTPFYHPMQIFTLRTGANDAPCAGAPNSGALIQTPDTVTPVELTINGVLLRLAATVFIQAQPDSFMTINVLDGHAEVEAAGESRFVPAGARVQIALDGDLMASGALSAAEPYAAADLDSLPVNNLTARFRIPSPLPQPDIDILVAAWYAPAATAIPVSGTPGADRCERTTRAETSLYAGPGAYFDVVDDLASGARVYPVLQTVDADGVIWWQLRQSSWIKAAAVETAGNCGDVPAAEYVAPPRYNTLSMETCETSNGPLRAGQWVEIGFVPPAYDTIVEAQQATSIDPGQVTVDDQWLWVYASNPIKIAEERYIVTHSADWQATAGTHRIVGERLTYTLICNLTVPTP